MWSRPMNIIYTACKAYLIVVSLRCKEYSSFFIVPLTFIELEYKKSWNVLYLSRQPFFLIPLSTWMFLWTTKWNQNKYFQYKQTTTMCYIWTAVLYHWYKTVVKGYSVLILFICFFFPITFFRRPHKIIRGTLNDNKLSILDIVQIFLFR